MKQIDIQHREPEPLRLDRIPGKTDEFDEMILAINDLCSSGYQAFCDLHIQEQRLRLFLNATESAIFGVDDKGICILINQVACDYFSFASQADLLGRNLFEMLARDRNNFV